MKRILGLPIVWFASACVPPVPPPAPQVRPAALVTASFGKTWQAAVDVFADKNVGIRTIDRSSGLIVADPVLVPVDARGGFSLPNPLADCGRDMLGHFPPPSSAVYNVRVKGDSSTSTVLVTVRWITVHSNLAAQEVVCATKGVWEGAFEKAVMEKAETPSPR